MAEHDPHIEYMARLHCWMMGEDPDLGEDEDGNRCPLWEGYTKEARRGLDFLQANGCKVLSKDTTTRPPFDTIPCWIDDEGWDQIWAAAPLTPRDK